jgi:alanyl-tRNA synthetase
VFAQTPGLPTDMNALLREVLEKYGGKGGGSRDFAQGALTSADSVEEALRAARVRLES